MFRHRLFLVTLSKIISSQGVFDFLSFPFRKENVFYWIFLFQSLFPLFLPKFMGVHFPFECLKYSLKNLHLGTAREKAMQIDLVVLVTTIILFTEDFRGKSF